MTGVMKKILSVCGVVAMVFAPIVAMAGPNVFAEGESGNSSNSGGLSVIFPGRSSGDDMCSGSFLGLVAWDCGVSIADQDDLKSNIWIIASNIAKDIAVIATYLVIGYVIYGGYLYTFSSGDPGKLATGKKTLVQAFTGLAITMLASIIVGAIRIALLGSNGGNIGNCTAGVNACVTANDLVKNLIDWVIGIAGVVSAVFLVYGGIQYVTSSGDPSKLKRAKDTILYALIGLAIVALTTVITAFVSNTIRDASKSESTSTTNNIIITKEIYDNKNS